MGLLSSLFGWPPVSADAKGGSSTEPVAGQFCQSEFPQMWDQFVHHVVDTAYTRACVADPDPQPPELPPLRVPAAKRLVAIGDLHGDLDKAKRAFKLAGLIDDRGVWTGGDTVCVQVGDILDRGDHELKLLYMLERLQRQASAAGGALWVLNGNHETMNVGGNFRYATQGADVEMAAWNRWVKLGQKLRANCNSDGCSSSSGSDGHHSASDTPAASSSSSSSSGRSSARQFNPLRDAALRPGGPIARRFFAPHPTVLQVGSTLFVHGGVLPSHVEYGLERINRETRAWLMGDDPSSVASSSTSSSGSSSSGSSSSGRRYPPPGFLRGADAVVWARDYSARDESKCDCDTLQQVLESLPGARRMVVGHTIQDRGINEACNGQVLRVDVGLSKGCGNGEVQVLEITSDGQQITRLREGLAPQLLTQNQQQQQQPQPPPQQQLPQPVQQQQQQQQEEGSISSWLPGLLRQMLGQQGGQQQQQEALGLSTNRDRPDDSPGSTRREPTPA